MKFPLIVLDLDGTLLNSNKEISNRSYNAITDCTSLGMKFIFATARPPRAVRSLLKEELLRLGSYIIELELYTFSKSFFGYFRQHEKFIKSMIKADLTLVKLTKKWQI